MNLSAVRRFEERVVSNGIPRWKKLIRSELHAKRNGARVIARRRTAKVRHVDPDGGYAIGHLFSRRTSNGQVDKVFIPRESFPRGKRLHKNDIVVLDLLRGDPSPVGCKVEILPRGSVVRIP